MITASFLLRCRGILEGVDNEPHLLLIAADWAEDNGEWEMAEFWRYCSRNGISPSKPNSTWWQWFDGESSTNHRFSKEIWKDQALNTRGSVLGFPSCWQAWLEIAVRWKHSRDLVVLDLWLQGKWE